MINDVLTLFIFPVGLNDRVHPLPGGWRLRPAPFWCRLLDLLLDGEQGWEDGLCLPDLLFDLRLGHRLRLGEDGYPARMERGSIPPRMVRGCLPPMVECWQVPSRLKRRHLRLHGANLAVVEGDAVQLGSVRRVPKHHAAVVV